MIKTKIIGTKDAQRKLRRISQKYPEAFTKATYREALRIFAVSQGRVPVDTGRLRASGGVTPPSGENPLIVIYYGVVYAGIVHEIHPTKSKFLEGPMLEARTGMKARIERDTLRLSGIT